MAKRSKETSGGGLSLRTKDGTAGGGTEGALATITEIGFVDEFTYGGRQKDNPQAALHVIFTIDGMEKPWEDNCTLGPSEKYEVSKDGYGIRSTGKQSGLNKSSKAYFFIQHLEAAAEEAGLDLDELLPEHEEGGHSVEPLEGRRVKLTNKPFQPVSGDAKDTVVIAAFVDDDEPPAKNGKAGKSGAGKSSTKGSSADDIAEATEEAVKALIKEHTSVKKGDLSQLVYAADKKNPDIKAMMQLCFKDSWVADEDRPWEFSKKTGKLTAKDED